MKSNDEIVKEQFNPYIWNISVETITQAKSVIVNKGCNSFTVTNLGDTIVTINQVRLFPSLTPLTAVGDSVSFGGNLGEIYKGNIDIAFVLPLGVLPIVEIVQKFYVKFEQ